MTSPLNTFVLFAQARSGSSNLLRMLQLHPKLRIAEEPLHEKYHKWHPGEPQYVKLIKDVPTLEEQLAALFSKHDGIKVLDYQLPEEIYAHLLLKPELKVVALRRRTLLQQLVSGFIAEQTGIWKMWDLKGELACAYKDLKPIDPLELQRRIEYSLDLRRYYGDVLSRKPVEMCLQLEYENLYTQDVEHNRESVRAVFEFLGLTLPETPGLGGLLNPRVSKINNTDTYALLPNAREIDEQFGSEGTGWLFTKEEIA